MNDRWYAIAGGVLALLVVIVLLVPAPHSLPQEVSWPTTADRGPEGLKGLQSWLERARVTTRSLRRRYDTLASDPRLTPDGNLLIVTLPPRTPARESELGDLRRWLERGNNILLLVAGGDLPGWSMQADWTANDKLLETLGYRFESEVPDADEHDQASSDERPNLTQLLDGLEPVERELTPRWDHPLTAGVESVHTRSYSAFERRRRLEGASEARGVLGLLQDSERQGPALWKIRVGDGEALVSGYAGLFSNAMLGRADNARLAANIVSLMSRPNGAVIFDDMHMGLSDLYDARAFFADPRLHATLWFILGFWLLYLIGRSRRLAPVQRPARGYRAFELTEAVAGLLARRLDRVSAARRLFRHFFDEVRARHGLPTTGEPAWSPLARSARLRAGLLRTLRRRHARTRAGGRVDLVALINLMHRARREMYEEHEGHDLSRSST